MPSLSSSTARFVQPRRLIRLYKFCRRCEATVVLDSMSDKPRFETRTTEVFGKLCLVTNSARILRSASCTRKYGYRDMRTHICDKYPHVYNGYKRIFYFPTCAYRIDAFGKTYLMTKLRVRSSLLEWQRFLPEA